MKTGIIPNMKIPNAILPRVEAFRKFYGYQFPRLGPFIFRTFANLMPDEVETELVEGIRTSLNLKDSTQLATYWQGHRFEYPTGDILTQWTDSYDAMFFDIGSNYGFFSYLLASRHQGLKIHAFEPNPLTYAKLVAIKNRNNLIHLHPWNIGLGKENTKLTLHQGNEDSGHSTFGTNPKLAGNSIGEVEIFTFDEWLLKQEINLPATPQWVAKIDVEGFELNVLQGMTKALTKKVFKALSIEINDYTLGFCGTSANEIFAFLHDKGYQPLNKTDQRKRWPLANAPNAFFIVS